MPKKPIKPKHVPHRTCVGCREVLSKRTLIRIVRRPEGIVIDPTGKLAGRGAYLHSQRSCWERGMKGALAHALKTELTQQDRETLQAFIYSLPEETSDSENTAMV
ncbi:MAG: YlxR family protein [Anaerolineales bacterium]|nr:YlxR family protein [Anaerolineales bacterium]